jgi:hypothetical protein
MVDTPRDVRINLSYEWSDLKSLLRYVKAHDVERDGRYDIRKLPHLNIWTHNWLHPGCTAESCLMFALQFNAKTGSLMSVTMQPGYNWTIFLDELAQLEEVALGKVVFGQHHCEPKT